MRNMHFQLVSNNTTSCTVMCQNDSGFSSAATPFILVIGVV